MTFDGRSEAEDLVGQRRLIFGADEFTVVVAGQERGSREFKLDAAARLRRIDIRRTDRDETGLGIYEIEGEELKLCYAQPGGTSADKL
jgi:uncharacterized protein (TIGR03067 family)